MGDYDHIEAIGFRVADWSRTPPTRPGFYWCRLIHWQYAGGRVPERVLYISPDGNAYPGRYIPKNMHAEWWLEPLVVPVGPVSASHETTGSKQ